MAKRRNGDNQSYQNGSFTEAELAPYVNNGKRYTLDFMDYNKGGWGWTRLDNVSIPGIIAPRAAAHSRGEHPRLQLELALHHLDKWGQHHDDPALRHSGHGTHTHLCAEQRGHLQQALRQRTELLQPGELHGDLHRTRRLPGYIHVSAVVMPDPALALVGRWVSGAENLVDSSATLPSARMTAWPWATIRASRLRGGCACGFSGKSLDLRAGEVGVMIANSSTTDGGTYLNTFDDQIRSHVTISFWAKGPGTWNPRVAKGGENGVGWQMRRVDADPVAGFTIRGLGNEDGRGSQINVSNNQPVWHHYAGVWDETTGVRSLYVDGVLSHDVNTLGQVMSMATGRHLTLGARQTDANGPYGNYFRGAAV